jgi:hypothetical protein
LFPVSQVLQLECNQIDIGLPQAAHRFLGLAVIAGLPSSHACRAAPENRIFLPTTVSQCGK